MTRTTTLVALMAAGLGLSACMSNEAGMSTDTSMSEGSEIGMSNEDNPDARADSFTNPTDGINTGPEE